MIKFGKPSDDVILSKHKYFEENDVVLARELSKSKIYIDQPFRNYCKICNSLLLDEIDFVKHDVGYKTCSNCNHLNGIFDDTLDFCKQIYSNDDGSNYAESYSEKNRLDYDIRVKKIYEPKAKFLIDSLNELGLISKEMSYLDFGAGSGYFLKSLNNLGVNNIIGYEVSKSQANLGNAMLGHDLIEVIDTEDVSSIFEDTSSEIVSLIGVLEHLSNPRSALQAIQKNKSIKYLYILVPMWSLSVYLEKCFPEGYHRHLSGGHTHLFTEESLKNLLSEFGFFSASEWWFGTDFIDLFRLMSVTMDKSEVSLKFLGSFEDLMRPLIDDFQLVLDKNKSSSELHILFRRSDK